MKIVFSTDQNYLHGGIEKVVAEKANYFSNLPGYEVYVITTEQKGKRECYSIHKNVRQIDLNINYNRNYSYFHPINLIKLPKHYWQLTSILKKIHPNVFVMCNYAPDFYWMPFVIKKLPKFKEFHSSKYFEVVNYKQAGSFLSKIKFQFENWIASKYDKLIVLNEDEKKLHNKSNAIVIPNPVTLRPELTIDLDSKLVITAGRISPVKGYDKLIEAWSFVALEFPLWKLHIYGDDYNGTQNKLNELIISNALEDKVVFKGTTQNMTKTMCNYSIFVMSSQTECFPMVLIEAMSVGLPVVSFDCETGPRNIIENEKEGVLVENQNARALGEALIKLMSDKQTLGIMSKNAKRKSHIFSKEVIMQKWEDLIQETVS